MSGLITKKFDHLEEEFLSQVRGRKPLIGYLCLRVPPELIEALDGVPMRIIPKSDFTPTGDPLIRVDGCSFCRSVSNFLKLPFYQGLSAIMGGACCDQQRRLIDTLHASFIPVMLYGAPRTFNIDSEYFYSETMDAFQRLARTIGVKLNAKKAFARIIQRNRLKRMVKKLRSEGKMPNSLLRRIASTPMPPEMALDFLAGIDESPSMVDRVCLLLAGSIPGAWEQEIIENSGARIVADATCLGDRVFQLETRESGDPYFNLYESYIEKNNCPHRRPVTSLIDYIREIISQSTKKPGQKIDGIIYRSLKYCHPWGLLAERIKREIPLPILRVDDDLASPAVESLRTRACAFTEMLNAKKKKTLA